MEEIRQTSSSTYETLANMDDASYIGSEIRLQKAPAWYGKHQTPNTGVFVLELIYLNCLATDFFHQHPLVSVKLWWLPWTYHWIWKGINNKTCGKFKRANIYFFASNVFFFMDFISIQSNQQQVLHPRIWSWGFFCAFWRCPEMIWDSQREKNTTNRTKGSKVAEAGIEAAFSSGIQPHGSGSSWIFYDFLKNQSKGTLRSTSNVC